MSLLGWLGKKIGLTDGKFWAQWFGTETWAGEAVTPTSALEIVTYLAGVRLIGQSVGMCPVALFERLTDGNSKVLTDHWLSDILLEPNADQSDMEFYESIAACLCTFGNFFSPKMYSGNRVVGLEPCLNPMQMIVDRQTPDGSLRYRYSDAKGTRTFTADQILHIRGFGFGGDLGLSLIQYGRQTLSSAKATERAAASTFANGMRPSGWLVYNDGKGGTLEQDARDLAQKNLIEPMQGAQNAGKIGILEGNFDYKQMTIPPEDAQLLQSRAFSVEEVCRLLGIPPVLLQHSSQGQTMFGSGVEQVITGWFTTGFRPYTIRIAKAIVKQMLPRAERRRMFITFDTDEMLRGDSKARSELYWKLVQMASATPNWVCKQEGLPPFEGGDVRFVNSTLMTLDEAIKRAAEPLPANNRNIPPPNTGRARLEVVQ